MLRTFILSAISLIGVSSCAQKGNTTKTSTMDNTNTAAASTGDAISKGTETATFGTGCFWCTEAIFQQLEGVIKVTSGYSGGQKPNPTYKEVCTGTTGHAECLNIVYDPSKISFDELLEVFWGTHDPTTLNRQGNDVGTQYRSVVFYHNEQQKQLTESYKAKLDTSGAWDNPIVTTLEPFVKFYPAEDYHQNYFNNNGEASYCQFVVRPKVEKFQKVFKSKLKH